MSIPCNWYQDIAGQGDEMHSPRWWQCLTAMMKAKKKVPPKSIGRALALFFGPALHSFKPYVYWTNRRHRGGSISRRYVWAGPRDDDEECFQQCITASKGLFRVENEQRRHWSAVFGKECQDLLPLSRLLTSIQRNLAMYIGNSPNCIGAYSALCAYARV